MKKIGPTRQGGSSEAEAGSNHSIGGRISVVKLHTDTVGEGSNQHEMTVADFWKPCFQMGGRSPEMMYNREMKRIYFWYSKKSLDWWSIPHFLFGVVIALSALVFSWSVPLSFLATFGIASLWEYFERHVRIHETPANSKMDILLPLLAFILTIFLMSHMPTQTTEDRQSFLIIALCLYGFVNFFAWRAKLDHDREFEG